MRRINLLEQKIRKILTVVGVLFTSCFFVAPYMVMVLASLSSADQLLLTPPNLLPIPPHFERYLAVAFSNEFGPTIINSLIVSSFATVTTLVITLPASYGVTRFRIKGRTSLLTLFIALMAFPSVGIIGYLYDLIRAIGLFDTTPGLILPYVAFNIAVSVWVLTNFFKAVPIEIEEAAALDGCSKMGILLRIVIPLIKPGLMAAALIVFINTWNEFVVALVLTITNRARTIPVGIASFQGIHETNWSETTTAAVIASLPVVVLAIFLRRWIISGLTAGAVKK